ncbi:hypothetical protein SDC9_81035 [bioreactor metagenome]|uniref:Uncharacterized protein n=1 Tax=bioreactor metagenome TaxID=1076179 RepID=A0A644Z150_9ZZZZ
MNGFLLRRLKGEPGRTGRGALRERRAQCAAGAVGGETVLRRVGVDRVVAVFKREGFLRSVRVTDGVRSSRTRRSAFAFGIIMRFQTQIPRRTEGRTRRGRQFLAQNPFP